MPNPLRKFAWREIVSQQLIEQKILIIRGQKVRLDRDLAFLYGVETFNLNKAVARNLDRFPDDFMFKLSKQEFKNLIFQNGVSSWGGTRKPPRAFTEHGILMLSSVLKSKRAVQVNIAIMWAFVRLRQLVSGHKELALQLNLLEHKVEKHDHEIRSIFEVIREIMKQPEQPERRIGFR